MFKINELDHVALAVTDVERTIRFYTQVVGLTPMARPNFGFPGAWLRIAGNQSVHIISVAENTAVCSSSRGNHFAICIASMPEAMAHLKEHKVEFTGPHNRPDGATQIFFQDPDGHTIEFCVVPR